jgi:hypothetical protein
MFTNRHNKDEGLQRAIDTVLERMSTFDAESDEYFQLAGRLSQLYDIQRTNAPDRVSADTLAVVAGNLAGIALIVNFERINVVTSKAIGFVMKTR